MELALSVVLKKSPYSAIIQPLLSNNNLCSNQIKKVERSLSLLCITLPLEQSWPSEVKRPTPNSTRRKTPGYDLILADVAQQLPNKYFSPWLVYNTPCWDYPTYQSFENSLRSCQDFPARKTSRLPRPPISHLPYFSKVFVKLVSWKSGI